MREGIQSFQDTRSRFLCLETAEHCRLPGGRLLAFSSVAESVGSDASHGWVWRVVLAVGECGIQSKRNVLNMFLDINIDLRIYITN